MRYMKNALLSSFVTTLLFLSITACGGGEPTQTPIAATASVTTAANSSSTSQTSQASTNSSTQAIVSNAVNNVSTGDKINGLPITNPTTLSRLSTAIANVPQVTQQSEATTYPIAGKQFFRNLVSLSGSDPTLNLLNSTPSSATTVVIIGEFQNFTAARIFPCTFNPTDYKADKGDCNTVNIAPGAYPAQSSAGSKCRSIAYQSGIIEQCILD
jgi:predicted small lipoprotein YifL